MGQKVKAKKVAKKKRPVGQKIILKLYAYKKRLATIELENEGQIQQILTELNSGKTFVQLGLLIIKTQNINHIEVIYK